MHPGVIRPATIFGAAAADSPRGGGGAVSLEIFLPVEDPPWAVGNGVEREGFEGRFSRE